MMPPGSRASLADGFFVTGDGVWSSLSWLLDSVPAHAFAVEFDAVSVMDETVQDGVGIGRIADDFVPAVDWKLGGDHRGAATVSFFEDFQEIMPGGGIEGLEAPVIEDEQIGAAQIAQKAGMASVAMRQGEVLEEPGHALVEDHRHTSAARHGHPRQADCARFTVAECFRRTVDRVDPP
jgi:hypothetical protein